MGFAIVQYDDRDVEMFKPLILKNKEYCKTHNINYIFFRSGWEKYPPWWRKVFLVRELLKNYEAVMWVDSDAAIVSCDHFKTTRIFSHFSYSHNIHICTF